MKLIGMLLVIMSLSGLPAMVSGSDYGTVTSEELKVLIDRNEPGLVIIDSRSQSQYADSHIKGAVSLPLMEMEQVSALPDFPKNATLVFYCSGTT
jgi:rhodanese-related sulfurtransferase